MSEQGWTKGPWRQRRETAVTDAVGNIICECSIATLGLPAFTFKERAANARLIAAAPAVYEALDALLPFCEPPDSMIETDCNRAIAKARAALASARGEKP